MLVIRFSRVGKKNHAQYKLVLAEKTYPIQGKFIEHLGSYDPHQKKAKLDKKRIVFWIEKGAQCSDSVHNLLIRKGTIKGEKRFLKISKKKKEGENDNNKEAKSDEKKDNKDDSKEGKEKEAEKEIAKKKGELEEATELADKKPENPKEEKKEDEKTEEISKDEKVEKVAEKPLEKKEEKK